MYPESVVFLIPKSELKPDELKLYRKLYKSQDISLMLKHDRKIIELFWKISLVGEILEVLDDGKEKVEKQLELSGLQS
jgi:hypothetical protein|tara:strand:- start:143 stop:376 length:234 start_codon:yes stop_codon:yes gene_type:complete